MNPSLRVSEIPGAYLIERKCHTDTRGTFTELYECIDFTKLNVASVFTQLNSSISKRNVLRGLHFQWDPPMGKTMWVVSGQALMVAVDLRLGSPTFGKNYSVTFVGCASPWQLQTPAGFARGFLTLEDKTTVQYLCTNCHNPEGEGTIAWNDPDLNIDWPDRAPLVSERDRTAQSLKEWLSKPESKLFQYDPERPWL